MSLEPTRRPPMVAVIGRKHAGKTTLVVELARALRRRGHRVMVIKHGSHTFNLDPATTDTYRHFHEGEAERVAMAAPDRFALVMRWENELPPEEIAERYMSDADVVVCEGFKRSALPRIEIHRTAVHAAPLFDAAEPEAARYLAIVTDDASLRERVPHAVAVIAHESEGWLTALTDLVEHDVMDR